MKKEEPEEKFKKIEEQEGGVINIALLIITAVLAFTLDLYDVATVIFSIIPPFDVLLRVVVFILEGASAITFWLYSREKAKRAKVLINILRSSYFIEMISDFIPAFGALIDFLPLRTISLLITLFIGEAEEITEETFKKVE